MDVKLLIKEKIIKIADPKWRPTMQVQSPRASPYALPLATPSYRTTVNTWKCDLLQVQLVRRSLYTFLFAICTNAFPPEMTHAELRAVFKSE